MLKLLNTTETTLNAGNTIPLNVVKKTNAKLSFDNNQIIFNSSGYFDINAMITLTSATVGDYVIQLYSNGSPINGALVRGTIATANDYVTLTLNDVESVIPDFNDVKAKISFVLVQGAGVATMTNANVSIVEIR